jgi:hemerythrin
MKWNPTQTTGHPETDQQLQQIGQLLEILMDHQEESMTSDVVSHLFSQLNRLLAEHFGAQDDLLILLGIAEHKRQQHRESHLHILEFLSLQLYEATFGRAGQLSEVLAQFDQQLYRHILEHDVPLRVHLFSPAGNEGEAGLLSPAV